MTLMKWSFGGEGDARGVPLGVFILSNLSSHYLLYALSHEYKLDDLSISSLDIIPRLKQCCYVCTCSVNMYRVFGKSGDRPLDAGTLCDTSWIVVWYHFCNHNLVLIIRGSEGHFRTK